MDMLSTAEGFCRAIEESETSDDLREAITGIAIELGFDYFALTHHVDVVAVGESAIRLHNYPSRWADYYDAQALGADSWTRPQRPG